MSIRAVKIALVSLLIYTAQATARLQHSAAVVDAKGMEGAEK